MQAQPYLSFEGRAEEAAEFYQRTIGAKLEMLMRFKESPEPPPPGSTAPGMENKVMHMSLRIGDTVLMGSDGHCSGKAGFQGFSLALSVANEAEAERVFKALSDGGQVQMPLTKTFFSPSFGTLSDRFGVGWMVMVEPEGAPKG
jgi:PhnB protein